MKDPHSVLSPLDPATAAAMGRPVDPDPELEEDRSNRITPLMPMPEWLRELDEREEPRVGDARPPTESVAFGLHLQATR